VARIDRFKRRLAERFPQLLAGWLKTLPATGFEGTTPDLWAAIDASIPRHEPLPMPKALLAALDGIAGVLAEAGFVMRRVRTNSARLVRIEPAGGTPFPAA